MADQGHTLLHTLGSEAADGLELHALVGAQGHGAHGDAGSAQGNGLIHVAEHDVLGGGHGAVIGDLAQDGDIAVLLRVPALIQDTRGDGHGVGLTGDDLIDGGLDAVQASHGGDATGDGMIHRNGHHLVAHRIDHAGHTYFLTKADIAHLKYFLS